MLAEQPDELQTFLLRASLLAEFDAGLCTGVFAPLYPPEMDWPRLLLRVRYCNLFVQVPDEAGNWLRLHHLFQEHLQKRLKQDWPAERAQLLRQAAEVYAARGEWEKACDALKQLEDKPALADMIERAGTPLARSGRFQALQAWLQSIPEIVDNRPALLSLVGRSRLN